jgi:2'-5' RNA ligase
MITVGVVIDVPEPHADRIRDARRSWGDPEAESVPPHVTIVAPVSVDPGEIPVLEEHLERAVVGCAPFRMRLRGTGTFRPVSPVVFLAVAEGIPGCEHLERRVRCGPWAVDLRFPYHPHVTVAFDLDEKALDEAFAAMSDFEAVFTVETIRLYELGDAGWRARTAYPLVG